MDFSSKLRNERELLGLKQKEFAEKLNIPPNTYNGYETGKRTPSLDIITSIADYLSVSVDYLLGRTNVKTENVDIGNTQHNVDEIEIDSMFKVPIIGTVRAGLGGIAEEDLLGFEYVYNNITAINDCFYLKVKGDSMEPHIAEGDLALIRRMDDIESGTLAVVVVNGDEGVIKKVIKKTGVIELHSFNPYYPVRIIKGEELQVVRIVGKVLETKRTW